MFGLGTYPFPLVKINLLGILQDQVLWQMPFADVIALVEAVEKLTISYVIKE